ncbi:hypothetical protein [Streptomyces sp. JH34]|uniref:hypothetical protein n=1 Tax=Streptomyces sp. JH34 TaxID=2793633 RepID=UPI0023F93C81|nr:hypothetical protein [Streptomyces sp. JH34]MDF6016911.1 hypothetical protein [Streptomyces sp. JH34]MDF6023127.1 hypothetical protein [Streptomyces sp. JH34]
MTHTPTATESTPASTAPSSSAEPAAVTSKNLRMPADYSLFLSDNPIKPRQDFNSDLSYTVANGLTSKSGKLVRLDSGQDGTRAECESETRYTDAVGEPQLTQGTRVCVLSNDHVGLVTIRTAPEQRDGGHFVTFDIIAWP